MKKILRYPWLMVLPMVAAAAVVWKASAAEPERQCPEVDPPNHTVLLPNPADCSTFFSCSNGVPILMRCPDGLHYNAELGVCDWPSDAWCEVQEAAPDCDGAPKKCQNGGCGSSSCEISFTFPIMGGTISASTTAQPGNFACCWIKTVLLIPDKAYGRSYSDKCCN